MQRAATSMRCPSFDWSQPSLQPFGEKKDAHADQDDKANCRIGTGKVETIRQFVDELAETAEVDEILDAHNIDQGKDQPEPHADEDGRQGRREQYLPELLPRREIEAAPHIDQHPPCGGKT